MPTITATDLDGFINQLASNMPELDTNLHRDLVSPSSPQHQLLLEDLNDTLLDRYSSDRFYNRNGGNGYNLPDTFRLGEDDVEFAPSGYRVERRVVSNFVRHLSLEELENGDLSADVIDNLTCDPSADWEPLDCDEEITERDPVFQPTLTESGLANLRAAFVNGEIENRIQRITGYVGTRDDYDYFNGIFSCEEENLEWFNNRLSTWITVPDLRLSESDVEWVSGGTRYWVEETRAVEVTVSPDEDEYDAQDLAERDDDWGNESYYSSQTAELVRAIFTESGLTRVRDAITAQVTAEVSTPTEPATDDA